MKVQLSNTTNLSDIHSDFAAMLDTLSRNWEVHIIEQTLRLRSNPEEQND